MFPLMSSERISESLPDSSADNRTPLVLFMSRERDTRVLFRTLLEMWGYRVEESESLEDSISIAESKFPSLLIMDTALPFVENLTKMQKMRQSKILSRMPIVLLSGHAQPRFRNLALSLGAADFLVKPVDFDLLEDCLKKNISSDGKNFGGTVL